MKTAALLIIFLSSLYFISRRLYRYLRYFQQEDYSAKRFTSWFKKNRAYDRRGSLDVIISALSQYYFAYSPFWDFWLAVLCAAFLWAVAAREEDPRSEGKIRLVMTARAKRIYSTALTLMILLSAALLYVAHSLELSLAGYWLLLLVPIQFTPFSLSLATKLLNPGEQARQQSYIREAEERIKELDPFIIGITGSYGKTTTKAFLGEVLESSLGATFWPKKGINSLMGVTRAIREELAPQHRWAIVEMGAYRRGSIKRLCELCPPKAAIITGIGIMHLERFGDEQTIYLAKSELAQAVPEDGILVCNGDNPGARKVAIEHRKKTTLLYGLNNENSDLCAWMKDFHATPDGTEFSIVWNGQEYQGRTPILGRTSMSNILASFTMACALGADPNYAIAAIGNLAQIDNRLELRKYGAELQLCDAYNSNPLGFRAALEVLEQLPGERKILVTPGMIELGEKQAEENRSVAVDAAKVCDIAIVVSDTNREAIKEGLTAGGMKEEQIHLIDDREEAFRILSELKRPKDVVLLENDLPDLYEAIQPF